MTIPPGPPAVAGTEFDLLVLVLSRRARRPARDPALLAAARMPVPVRAGRASRSAVRRAVYPALRRPGIPAARAVDDPAGRRPAPPRPGCLRRPVHRPPGRALPGHHRRACRRADRPGGARRQHGPGRRLRPAAALLGDQRRARRPAGHRDWLGAALAVPEPRLRQPARQRPHARSRPPTTLPSRCSPTSPGCSTSAPRNQPMT